MVRGEPAAQVSETCAEYQGRAGDELKPPIDNHQKLRYSCVCRVKQRTTHYEEAVEMASTVVQIRMEESLKDEASALFEELGLDLPTAIRMFLKKSISYEGIPFDVQRDVLNSETIRTIKDAEKGIGLCGPYSSVSELMEALNADD